MTTATFVKSLDNFNGEAKLYELSEPITYKEDRTTRFVAVSAVIAMFSGPETYIFPCDENGKVLDWGELDGSYRGGLSHEKALEDAGYDIKVAIP